MQFKGHVKTAGIRAKTKLLRAKAQRDGDKIGKYNIQHSKGRKIQERGKYTRAQDLEVATFHSGKEGLEE